MRKHCPIFRENVNFGRPRAASTVRAAAVFVLMAATGVCLAQPAKKTTKPDPKTAEQGKELFGKSPKPADADRFWSILIVAYPDDPDMAAANQALERVRTETDLAEAYADRRGKNSVVCVGKYDEPNSPDAQASLQRIRNIEWNGTKPFAGAVLTPPEFTGQAGSMPEFDLLKVRGKLNKRKKNLYTLEVAEYSRPDRGKPTDAELQEYRKAAESAAVILRREGNEAYYCHLPMASVVTVGLFDDEEYKTSRTTKSGSVMTITPIEGPRLAAIRKKFPAKLLNGAGVRVKRAGAAAKEDLKPAVVEVPEEQ